MKRVAIWQHRSRAQAITLLLASMLAQHIPRTAYSEPPSVRVEMQRVVQAFRELQPYLVRRERFMNPTEEGKISEILERLQGGFHEPQLQGSTFSKEPGFKSTLAIATALFDDARNRFKEGKKGYALWRLKTAANHCVSCHTRYEIKVDLSGDTDSLEGLNAFEKGEFYLASRQLSNAKAAFMAAVEDPTLAPMRAEALRKWLVMYVRVSPDPEGAIDTLSRVLKDVPLVRSDREEVQEWIDSMYRWQKRGTTARVPPLAEAENLIRQGLGMNDPLSGKRATVELLRATALLHRGLDDGSISGSDRARALYSLGRAYSALPLFFANELPELFLEQAIRENPNSDIARRSYGLYQEVVTLGYTGSSGTNLPDDVRLALRELHDLAYGVPSSPGKV